MQPPFQHHPDAMKEHPMRDLNIDELEQVYGSGCWTPCGCGDSPTPPSCDGSKSKRSKNKSKSKRSKNKSKSKKHSMKCW